MASTKTLAKKKTHRPPTVTTAIRMPADTLEQLQAATRQVGLSVSEFVRRYGVTILQEYVQAEQKGGFLAVHETDGTITKLRFV